MKMLTIGLLAFALSAQEAEARRVAFVFASFSDKNQEDPIDRNLTWRSVAKTYHALRQLGIPKKDIIIFYNDTRPDRSDNDLRGIDTQPLYEGEYPRLKEVFGQKTKNLTSLDEVILTTLSHGGDNGRLYPDYGGEISGGELNRLVSSTKARTVTFYSACYAGSLLPKSNAPHTVFVTTTDHKHTSWSDRNYCDNADFFEAFTTPRADTNGDKKVSFEEAAAYTKNKWIAYKKDFLDKYLVNEYKWEADDLSKHTKQQLINEISTDPLVKRGKKVPLEWTLKKE
ncbi:hypothetical protein HY639_00925 [Candidatus Woesearchaeota archaeon]|nr:hypothetical protein [Candidatus Woesearchaeota archaeon]